jgi:hypothetical protein
MVEEYGTIYVYITQQTDDISHYFSKKRTTHVVCRNLAASTAHNLLKGDSTIKIVSPEWLLECCRQKKRLSEIDFAVLSEQVQICWIIWDIFRSQRPRLTISSNLNHQNRTVTPQKILIRIWKLLFRNLKKNLKNYQIRKYGRRYGRNQRWIMLKEPLWTVYHKHRLSV